jgi:hypothetical protein
VTLYTPSTTPVPDSAAVIVYPADSEHNGLRLAVLGTFFGIAVIAFVIANTFIPGTIIPIGIGVGVAYGITLIVERQLKRTWHSGRAVRITPDGLTIDKNGVAEVSVLSEDPARALFWHFVIDKRARIPKGWSMFACAVHIDTTTLAVYTFLPPDRADSFPRRELFRRLEPTRSRAPNDERPDLRLAGEQKRLRDAENVRWTAGAELSPDDLAALIDQIAARYPQWMPNP